MDSEPQNFAMPDASWKVTETDLPRSGMLVKYRTALYQMFGYLDMTGRWIATDGREELLPVKAWREISDCVSPWPERA